MTQIVIPDVSRWQGTIDFDKLKNQVPAIIIKATGSDGGNYTDSMFARNRSEARRVGLPAAFYHYKGAGSATDQANYMLGVIGALQPGEFIILDDENEGKVNGAFNREFNDVVKSATGLQKVTYSNQARFQGADLNIPNGAPAIVAKYGANTGRREDSGAAPQVEGLNIVCWQYTSAARLDGITANTVDMNVFYGSIDDFTALGAKGVVPFKDVPSVPATAPGNGTYVVQPGDSLSLIGQKIGMNWQNIATMNGIVAPYTIYPNQVLKVYGGTMGQQTAVEHVADGGYVVVPGDTLSGIGVKTGHNWQDIAKLNGINAPYTIYPKQRLALPGGGVTAEASTQSTYTVVSGDTLSGIGERLGKSWKAIADMNGIAAPYTIYPRQVLKV